MTGNALALEEGVMELRADVRRLEARIDSLADVIRRWLELEPGADAVGRIP